MTYWYNYSLIKFLSFWYWIQFFIIFNYYFNDISAIVVPSNTVKIIRIEDPRNRELIDISKKKEESNPERLEPVLSCLQSFVNLFLNRQPLKITVLVTEFIDIEMEQVYLTAINNNRPAFILSGDINWESYTENAFEIVILLETPESVENITHNLINLGDDDCRYGVIVTQKYSNEESFMEVARFLIVKLWEKRIAHAAILGIIRKSMVVAKSTSFMPIEYQHPLPPILMDRCNSEKDWDESIDIFASMDMNNCSVLVGYFPREPYIRISNDSQVTGLEALILKIVARKYNFHIFIEKLEWENGTAEEAIVKERLSSNGSIDLVLGGILWAPVGYVDFTIPYDVVQVVWLIPIHSNISLRGLVTPLSTKVWFGVIAVIICTVVLQIFLFKEISLLEIVALVIGVGWPKQPIRDSSRIQFISYVLFGFLLVQFYLASMAGQFMASADEQIQTMGDLVKANLIYGGTKSHYLMFSSLEETPVGEKREKQKKQEEEEEEDPNETGIGVIELIAQNFVIFDQLIYTQLLEQLSEGENTSIALTVTKNVSSVGSKFDYHKVHILNEVLYSYPLAFPLWKGLPYLDRVDDTIRRLTETGIMLYLGRITSWEDGAIYHDYEDFVDDANLRLNDLAPGFLLLIMGYGLGLVSLAVEIAFKRLDTHLKNKQKIKDKMKLKKQKRKKLRVKSNKNFQQNFVGKSKDRKNTISWDVMDSRRVIVQQAIRPNVTIGYYKDMY